MFTDSHCHLLKEYYDDINQIIMNASINNVTKIITCGCDYKSNLETMEIISDYKDVYGAIGIHPTEIKDVEKTIDLIEKNIINKKIIAIGEIGLDYHYDNYDKLKQQEVFKSMLDIAKKYNKPVIIHSRDAFNDTYDILKNYSLNGIIHSFSGDLEMARKYIELGYLIGINGTITFKNSKLLDVIKEIPIEKILVETDSPYLSPEPFRGIKNEPKNIIEIVKFLSLNLSIKEEKLNVILAQNLRTFFDI